MADNTALFTAWANDDGYERVFAEQLRNLARPQDVLVLISCSGSSPNVLAAARAAREMDVRVVAMTAPDTPLHDLADLPVSIPARRRRSWKTSTWRPVMRWHSSWAPSSARASTGAAACA